nr:MAG TPA: hypothetical protein [Caudoviricetes sp.]
MPSQSLLFSYSRSRLFSLRLFSIFTIGIGSRINRLLLFLTRLSTFDRIAHVGNFLNQLTVQIQDRIVSLPVKLGILATSINVDKLIIGDRSLCSIHINSNTIERLSLITNG